MSWLEIKKYWNRLDNLPLRKKKSIVKNSGENCEISRESKAFYNCVASRAEVVSKRFGISRQQWMILTVKEECTLVWSPMKCRGHVKDRDTWLFIIYTLKKNCRWKCVPELCCQDLGFQWSSYKWRGCWLISISHAEQNYCIAQVLFCRTIKHKELCKYKRDLFY